MNTYETLILVTVPPYQQRRSEEILEAIMSLALFDRDHAVIFWDQGLAWLTPEQQPSKGKSLSRQLEALPLYGSDALFFCQQHRAAVLGDQPIADTIEPISLTDIAMLMRQSRYVEVF
ncbi:DsrE family protein [Saccharospirillum sp. HFRX-1]|uniref:DsrE family protein n=1 Tax=unclassified Saccharospirillum TaxID=2633430 RepID=UPI003719A712